MTALCVVPDCNRAVRCKSLCSRHYGSVLRNGVPVLYKPTMEERFWAKVNKTDDCWIWVGAQSRKGYGNLKGPDGYTSPHRYAYELLVGPIPEGLVIDHLCRNPSCCNPEHLEPVTNRENLMRGMHPKIVTSVTLVCKRGHDMQGDGSYVHPRWGRACRACRKMHRDNLRAAKRVAA